MLNLRCYSLALCLAATAKIYERVRKFRIRSRYILGNHDSPIAFSISINKSSADLSRRWDVFTFFDFIVGPRGGSMMGRETILRSHRIKSEGAGRKLKALIMRSGKIPRKKTEAMVITSASLRLTGISGRSQDPSRSRKNLTRIS